MSGYARTDKPVNVVWEDPPQRISRRWEDILTQVRARPGAWALLDGVGLGVNYAFLRDKGLEVTSRGRRGEERRIYVRWPRTNAQRRAT